MTLLRRINLSWIPRITSCPNPISTIQVNVNHYNRIQANLEVEGKLNKTQLPREKPKTAMQREKS
jgi:hypothetical protein